LSIHIRRRYSELAALVLVAISASCGGHAGFVEPIDTFQTASATVIAATRVYITELNKVEREKYILSRVAARKSIDLSEVEAVQVFDTDGLHARVVALDQLETYGSLLASLASSDAPARIHAEASGLGESLKALDTTVEALHGPNNANFKAAVGPVSDLIGGILELVAEQKIRDALKRAIEAEDDPINTLLSVISDDMRLAYQRKRNMLSAMRTDLRDEYERALAAGADAATLRAAAEAVRAHEDRWEAFASANPATGLNAMRDAHAALVKYARSAGKPSDILTLAAAMEAFAARAQALGQAVHALKGI
jgi:hypothetical protein